MNLYKLYSNPEELFGYDKIKYIKPDKTSDHEKIIYKHPMFGIHRDDGPAVIYNDGRKKWYKNGKLHREDGPAFIYADGSSEWYKNGKRHRDDGPAVIYNHGRKAWYKDGKRHRDDGPAIIFPNGETKYYINGNEYSKEDFNKMRKK